MANYYAYARSNYFKVKDLPAFGALCRKWNLEKIDDGMGRVGFLVQAEDGLSAGHYYDAATGEIVDAGFEQELASHLEPGGIAIVIQVGWEKLRYLTGWSWAVNADGEMTRCDLEEIYERAKQLKPKGKVTLCEY